MHAKEMILTGASLSVLAYWELGIGEIPLGLISISHSSATALFSSIIVLKLLVSAVLITLGLRQVAGKVKHIVSAFLYKPAGSPEKNPPAGVSR